MDRTRSAPSRTRPAVLAAALLIGGAALGQVSQRPSQTPAPNPIPDSGAQLQTLIAEVRAGNQKLAEIAALLREIRDRQDPGRPPPGG